MTPRRVRRYRMAASLPPTPATPPTPAGVSLVGWDDSLLEAHAATLVDCFLVELDAELFPALANVAECTAWMQEITASPLFLPAATWLATGGQWCGTVQGSIDADGAGIIHNVAVAALARGRGVGAALLWQAMAGLHAAGARAVKLDVSADNRRAIRLYERFGFRRTAILLAVTG